MISHFDEYHNNCLILRNRIELAAIFQRKFETDLPVVQIEVLLFYSELHLISPNHSGFLA